MTTASDDVTAADGSKDLTTTAVGRESTAHLLRLFKVEPCTHRVITRQDLIRDYDAIPSPSIAAGLSRDTDNGNDNGNEETIAINHYYTWNSSRTNAPIQKERAAIISALHSRSKSATALPAMSAPFLSQTTRPLPGPTKSFTRSHRVRDIVSMCTDGRCAFSADEYHNNETADTADAEGRPPPGGYAHDDAAVALDGRRSHVGRGSRCWSCTGTVGSDEDDSDDNKNADREWTRTRPPKPSTWKRKLSQLLLFKKKRDKR